MRAGVFILLLQRLGKNLGGNLPIYDMKQIISAIDVLLEIFFFLTDSNQYLQNFNDYLHYVSYTDVHVSSGFFPLLSLSISYLPIMRRLKCVVEEINSLDNFCCSTSNKYGKGREKVEKGNEEKKKKKILTYMNVNIWVTILLVEKNLSTGSWSTNYYRKIFVDIAFRQQSTSSIVLYQKRSTTSIIYFFEVF
jgi:hypothetical protein